ncbi:MAG: LuxR C-terminal-related transcriptional regulator [Syntrophomonadaceae bacterium]|nr:LuxR C-terminal-related transcriptional regulator [Syntrophomonadaceae bacterium]MDD3890495.1 LuxR C-terminal-related transcriptional regulator [Syntrophomonadaceae bacterium]
MKNRIFQKIELLKQEFWNSGANGIPLDFRLFLFLVVLVLTIILGVIAILFITGTFTAGLSGNEKIVENELLHVSQGISQQYGDLSLQAIEFSKQLSQSMEGKTGKLGIPVSNLQDHPEMLEEIISDEFDRVLFSLQRAKSSGVFFILNATVNPALDNAENSRAGLYIKNMEPNIISSSAPNIIILRGVPSISRNNSLSLHAQWKMEFDVSDAPYYHRPMNAAHANKLLPLSRLYYWSTVFTMPDTSEEVMLCSVPLIDSHGNVFGVCGFEISSMLFKLSHMPNNSIYNRLFCVLSPIKEGTIEFHQSMFAGGYSARIISKGSETLKVSENRRSFYSYRHDQDSSFLGIHTPIHLYPQDSAFADEQWVAAIMVPEEDVVSSISKLNLLLIALLMLLVLLGIIASFILSRRFLQPISEGFDIIKSSDLSAASRTNIPEINDLIDFLALHNEELYEKARQEKLSLSMLDEFLENTKTLSPAERLVFDLYVKGHTAKESAEILCLSINTIKTHNKRIYTKLNVTSREELLLYISMLKEIGTEI